MEITFKQLSFDCAPRYETVEAEKKQTYRGYDIYMDADKWYYVRVNGEWNYFSSIREAQHFIRNIWTN